MKLTRSATILGCMVLSFLTATAALGAAPPTLAEADALLNGPTLDLSQAARALSLYKEALSKGGAARVMVLARLARTCFVLGQIAPQAQKMEYYRQGQDYAATLLREAPDRVEGHYWLALNFCGQSEEGGKFLGRKLLPRIIEELQRALALDETYVQAGAHRVLGRIYYEAPGWPLSVGDLTKSLEHLKAAVRLAPGNSTNHLYLAQSLMRLPDNPAAAQQLALVLKSTGYVVRPQDLEEDRREARRLLAEIKGE